jgi:putative transposase
LRYCPPEPKASPFYAAKQADGQLLKLWAQAGAICLKYLDESGFERCSSLNYTYARRGKQKRIAQARRRGRRISALGLWEPNRSFEYGLVVGGFNSQRYVALMNWQAEAAAVRLMTTGQLTVVIQDGASSHRSKLVKQHWQRWSEQGLLVFFLPPYSPQMNRIEDEWLHLKRESLASRLFEDEYDLSLALIAAIEQRGEQGNYSVERFKFIPV